jgi:hypothetical protein
LEGHVQRQEEMHSDFVSLDVHEVRVLNGVSERLEGEGLGLLDLNYVPVSSVSGKVGRVAVDLEGKVVLHRHLKLSVVQLRHSLNVGQSHHVSGRESVPGVFEHGDKRRRACLDGGDHGGGSRLSVHIQNLKLVPKITEERAEDASHVG